MTAAKTQRGAARARPRTRHGAEVLPDVVVRGPRLPRARDASTVAAVRYRQHSLLAALVPPAARVSLVLRFDSPLRVATDRTVQQHAMPYCCITAQCDS